jgi:hypothetical protein
MAPTTRPPTISQIAMRFLFAIAAGSVGRATKGQATLGRSVEGNRLQEATSATGKPLTERAWHPKRNNERADPVVIGSHL